MNRLPFLLILIMMNWCFWSFGCSKSPTTTANSAPDTAKLSTQGATIFEMRCSVCHGREGKGDGPASRNAAISPRDLTDSNWQQSVSDEQIGKVIRNGGPVIGKSPAMPPNPDLTDTQVQALSQFIRTLEKINRYNGTTSSVPNRSIHPNAIFHAQEILAISDFT